MEEGPWGMRRLLRADLQQEVTPSRAGGTSLWSLSGKAHLLETHWAPGASPGE